DAFAKLKIAEIKSTMKGQVPGFGDTDLTVEDTFQLPTKFKKVLTGKSFGQEVRISWAIEGDKFWFREGDKPAMDFDLKGKPGAAGQSHPLSVLESLLAGATKDQQLALLKDVKVDGGTLLVVEHQPSGQPSLTLYVDKETGLLTKTKQK